MSYYKAKRTHLPCAKCGSKDALAEYENGTYCFSCVTFTPILDNRGNTIDLKDKPETTIQFVPYRSHSRSTLEFFNVKQEVTNDGEIYATVYPGPKGSFKRRILGTKEFVWENYQGPGLMGKEKFSAGSAQAITITEGEEDMLSVYEMLGSKYPVVSVQSSSQAARDCSEDKAYLDSFEKIYLCFDNDAQGAKASNAVSALFPYSKIYIVKKDKYKDANAYQEAGEAREYNKIWWAAKRHDPENIVSSFSDLEKLFSAPKKKAIATFPFKGLQEATYGIRTGETYLIKALEGIGKTEILGACEYHVCKTTDYPIGVIHLEEDTQRAAFRLVGYEVDAPVHLEGFADYSTPQLMEIYTRVAKTDNRINYYQAGKNDQDVASFLNAIRFMVASAGCKIVFFDHISRVATSFNLDTAGLDNFATSLSKLAIELDFALIMITHVNDDGLTRGSRNISKEAWTVISLNRDKLSADPLERNTTYLTIEKNRHASITGPAGSIYFDPNTFKLSDELPKLLPPTGSE